MFQWLRTLTRQPWWEPGVVVYFLRRHKIPNGVTQGGAGLFAFSAGITGEHFKLWEGNAARTWYQWWIEVLTFCVFSLVAAAISLARENVKVSDSDELITTKALLDVKNQQLNSWIHTSSLIRQIIKQKQAKLVSIAKRRLTLGRAMVEIWTRREPQLILRILYDQFRVNFDGGRFRIVLFVKSTNPYPHLTVLYSYDGVSHDCCAVRPENFRLDAGFVKAEVAKHYNEGDDHSFRMIEDCSKSAEFVTFSTNDKKYIRSLMTFKHDAQARGDALILSVDCDEAGFFKASMAETYKHLVIEMMHRLEYQLLVLQVRDSLRSSRRAKPDKETK